MTTPTGERVVSAPPESDEVTIQDIADMSGKHINTVFYWAQQDLIPGCLSEPWRKKNRTWDRKIVEDWLATKPKPRSDELFGMGDIARVVGVGTNAVKHVVRHPTFPKPRVRRKWLKTEVREWNNVPRCTYGTGENACWELAEITGPHELLMCPKHAQHAHQILDTRKPYHHD